VIESNPISIVEIGGTLVATIGGSLDDATALRFQSELAERVAQTQARGVIIDLSAVELVDSFIGRVLADHAVVRDHDAAQPLGLREPLEVALEGRAVLQDEPADDP